jgi:hypothetical protein
MGLVWCSICRLEVFKIRRRTTIEWIYLCTDDENRFWTEWACIFHDISLYTPPYEGHCLSFPSLISFQYIILDSVIVSCVYSAHNDVQVACVTALPSIYSAFMAVAGGGRSPSEPLLWGSSRKYSESGKDEPFPFFVDIWQYLVVSISRELSIETTMRYCRNIRVLITLHESAVIRLRLVDTKVRTFSFDIVKSFPAHREHGLRSCVEERQKSAVRIMDAREYML